MKIQIQKKTEISRVSNRWIKNSWVKSNTIFSKKKWAKNGSRVQKNILLLIYTKLNTKFINNCNFLHNLQFCAWIHKFCNLLHNLWSCAPILYILQFRCRIFKLLQNCLPRGAILQYSTYWKLSERCRIHGCPSKWFIN